LNSEILDLRRIKDIGFVKNRYGKDKRSKKEEKEKERDLVEEMGLES
jgi:hypothetical protein